MRIAVDCRYVRIDRHDGISRYTAGLVTELAALRPVVMLISDRRQLRMLPDLPWHRISSPTGVREPLVAWQVNRLAPDVVFSPMQTMGSLGRRYRLVLTVHDLIYYRHPAPPRGLPTPIRALWRLYHLAWWPQRLLLDRGDAVVTVSNTTAALIATHHLTRRPVTIVPNAADPLPGAPEGLRGDPADVPVLRGDPTDVEGKRGHPAVPEAAVPKAAAPRTARRLVYMGSFMPYKNVDTLVRAAAALPDHELHLMSRVDEMQRARLTALAPGARLVFHDGASDTEYATVLRGATALVSASRDEGFGIPLIEAMSVGTPVVVSDIPVFREVGGDAAAYVAPDDVDGFVAAIRALDDPTTRAARGDAARERAAHYTWAASARTLLDLLEGLV